MHLADEFVAFTKLNFPCGSSFEHLDFQCSPYLYARALFVELNSRSEISFEEIEQKTELWKVSLREATKAIGSEALSTLDKMKKYCEQSHGCSAIPKEITRLEAHVYKMLGNLNITDDRAESALTTKKYFNMYRDLSESIGDMKYVSDAEMKLSQLDGIFGNRDKKIDADKNYINVLRENYRQNPNDLNAGMGLASALASTPAGIEGERLVAELLSTSRRIHGLAHHQTKMF